MAIFVVAFLALAIPLTTTLVRITQEATMRSAATDAIREACGGKDVDIAQIDVSWPLFDDPTVDALVIAPTYSPNAEQDAERLLASKIDEDVRIHLQQVQAADLQSQTRAMIDAAMERTTAGIAADVPPYDRIRASIGLPTRSIWTNRAERRVYLEPIPAPEWTLADYGQIELIANEVDSQWNVRVIPPPEPVLRVSLVDPAGETEQPEDTIAPELAGWALLRWGMSRVAMEAPDGTRTQAFIKGLKDAGIEVNWTNTSTGVDDSGGIADTPPPVALIRVYSLSPTRAAAAAAAAAARREQEAQAARNAEASE